MQRKGKDRNHGKSDIDFINCRHGITALFKHKPKKTHK